MNKKGITLIALIITIIVLLILATVSIAVITDGNIIERARETRKEEKIESYKETIRAALNQALNVIGNEDLTALVMFAESELNKMRGLEEVTVTASGDDYVVSMPDDIEITFEEATGKKLPLYVETYVTRSDLEGR